MGVQGLWEKAPSGELVLREQEEERNLKKKKKNNREEEQRREEEPSYSCWMSARNALNLPSDLVWQWNVLVALGSLLQTAP